MSKFRRAAKVDKSQLQIVLDLRMIPGVTVALPHDDILVGYNGETFWFEIKSPDVISKVTGKPRPSAIKKSQNDIKASWTGHYSIVWSIEQILDQIGVTDDNPNS